MRNPDNVLNSLASKSHEKGYRYEKIYRNLYNPEFFLKAYAKIYAKEGNMTKGVDNLTIDGMSTERINKIIESIKNLSYQPKPAKRVYIPKKNGDKRPLGLPSIDDKLVQEVVRSILESIYEGNFSNLSHGFRPNRSCHTALKSIERKFNGARWFVEGDIKGFFDNINHQILVKILRKKITDEKFIQLIWKFLKAGYLENWRFNKTYSGTPQGGIISPILSNIYLNELDKYIEKYIRKFNIGKKSTRRNPEYRAIEWQAGIRTKQLQKNGHKLNEEEKGILLREIKEFKTKLLKTNPVNPMDNHFKRLYYVRYADDFLIGIIGSKTDALKIKEDLTVFIREELKLELSDEKTLITNTKNNARFLGYDIKISRSQQIKKDKNGIKRRSCHLKPLLQVPKEVWIKSLLDKKALKIIGDKWKSMHRVYLKDLDDLEIINIFNAEIRGLYNFYKLALNVSVLNKYSHIMEYSMYKTYANKYKKTVPKIISRFNIEGKFGIKYETKKGNRIRYYYDEGFKRQKLAINNKKINNTPNTIAGMGRTSLLNRLLANQCEWCESIDNRIEIHHVRKLKDLKGKKFWEKHMIARRRKTIAMCRPCHINLHTGKLD